MRIFIGLISSNEKISSLYQRQQTGLIPKDISQGRLKKLLPIFQTGTFNPQKENRALEEYLLHSTRNSDAAILLIEEEHESIAHAVRNSFFSAIVTIDHENPSPRNSFGHIFARLLKNFASLLDAMGESDNEQAMILPLRNFNAEELKELARICREESMSKQFNNSIGVLVSTLKARKRPRKKSNYRTTYFIDNDKKHFEYGKEIHSRLPTGKPHLASCEIAGNFRFGKRIVSDRHFNVSCGSGDKTTISGIFPNCHDELVSVKEATHLNMFSNDCQ